MEVLCEIRNHVAFITLNRPAALNALSLDMILQLRELLGRSAADPEIYAVLMRGAGEKAFCAGGDIRALYQSFKSSRLAASEFFAAEYPLDYLLYSYPKPYLVLMDGITLGGGMGIAQGSSACASSANARGWACRRSGSDSFPTWAAAISCRACRASWGVYLALTGVQIRAADALYSRLADVYLPPAAIASLSDSLAQLRWSEDHAADLRRCIDELRATCAGRLRRPGCTARRHRCALLAFHGQRHSLVPGAGNAQRACRLGAVKPPSSCAAARPPC